MARQNVELLTFNRGLVSPMALARTDIKRVGLSAEVQTNWMPQTLGPMSLRPGWEYESASDPIVTTPGRHIPFIFAVGDTAILKVEPPTGVVPLIDGAPLTLRNDVNGLALNVYYFDAFLTGWTNADEAGAASTAEGSGFYRMRLEGTGTNRAIRYQTVAVGAYSGVRHSLRVNCAGYGETYLRVGSTVGGEQYLSDVRLYAGNYLLSFVPTADFTIYVHSRDVVPTRVSNIYMDKANPELRLTYAFGWTPTEDSYKRIGYAQSGDVVYITSSTKGSVPVRVVRYGGYSWATQPLHGLAVEGPFGLPNTSDVTIESTALTGDVTLTASAPVLSPIGAVRLVKLRSVGQDVTKSITAENIWSDPIRVTGVGEQRAFTVDLSGGWVATVTLQRSVGAPGSWQTADTYTTNTTVAFKDGLDNQIIYYRIGVATADFTSGPVYARLYYPLGSIPGVVLGTINSSTSLTGVVIKTLGGTTATPDWSVGDWYYLPGGVSRYPSAVSFHEGRLWYAGLDSIYGSVSDNFDSFDEDYVGDAGPISRSIASRGVDTVNWLQSGDSLLAGGEMAEYAIRSSALGEPLTPTNFNIKEISTRGSAGVSPVKVDGATLFVDRSGRKVCEITYSGGQYVTTELTVICPEACSPSVTRLDVQRSPGTRVHGVLSDGAVAVLVYDKAEEVRAWVKVVTEGDVEDVVVLPGGEGVAADEVRYSVARVIESNTWRYLERWVGEEECVGGTLNKQADSFKSISQASSTTITGLSHLEGESVVCWANGKDLGTYTVASGSITVSEAVTTAIVGLPYTARFKSAKLAHAAQAGSALTQKKRVDHIGLLLADTHYQGLRYGPDFDTLDDLPLVEEGDTTAADTVHTYYDADSVEFNGGYDTDSRICLEASAPRPCTVMGLVLSMTTHEKI